MVEISEAVKRIKESNPRAKPGPLRMAADAAITYAEASENVRRLGSIVVHPQTGAPIDNPYLKIRERQAAILLKAKTIDAGEVIPWLEEQFAAEAAEAAAKEAE